MVILIVLLTVVVFFVVDLLLRTFLKRVDEAKRRKQREEALDIGLRITINRDAPSLKSVEVPDPKARILAVDDESIVLDSFRKILVLAGYSVDTVETGPEALGLVEQSDYDFVFTDMKMPDFDGLEVTKAVKHMRPDIDVIMITGYATVESAVETMKFGAMDFVEKPFTEGELTSFVNQSTIRRKVRIERQQPPKVQLVTTSSPEVSSDRVFNVPAGVFISSAHVWARIEMTGDVRAGMDDFSRKMIGEIDEVVLPKVGKSVNVGDPLFSIRQKSRVMSFPSPVRGRVTAQNEELSAHPDHLAVNPYEVGWICRLEADRLTADLESLRIGADAIAWYRKEIERLSQLIPPAEDEKNSEQERDRPEPMSDEAWDSFSTSFLRA